MTMMTTPIEVDARGRLSLPKSLRGDGATRFLAQLLPGGDVLLQRAAIVPEVELKLTRNPEFEEGFAQLEAIYGEELE